MKTKLDMENQTHTVWMGQYETEGRILKLYIHIVSACVCELVSQQFLMWDIFFHLNWEYLNS